MVQPHNRSHSMSVYLAALTFPDTIILCLGKWNLSLFCKGSNLFWTLNTIVLPEKEISSVRCD